MDEPEPAHRPLRRLPPEDEARTDVVDERDNARRPISYDEVKASIELARSGRSSSRQL